MWPQIRSITNSKYSWALHCHCRLLPNCKCSLLSRHLSLSRWTWRLTEVQTDTEISWDDHCLLLCQGPFCQDWESFYSNQVAGVESEWCVRHLIWRGINSRLYSRPDDFVLSQLAGPIVVVFNFDIVKLEIKLKLSLIKWKVHIFSRHYHVLRNLAMYFIFTSCQYNGRNGKTEPSYQL